MKKGVIFLLSAAICLSANAETRYIKKDVDIEEKQEEKQKQQDIDLLDKKVTINIKGVPLPYFASILSEQAGIPIVIREINYPALAAGGMGGAAPLPPMAGPGGGFGGVASANDYMTISYFSASKPLRYILEEITSSLDLWWKREDDRIVIYKYESKSYALNLPFLKKSLSERADPLTLTYDRDFISGLESSFKNLLRDQNSKVSVNNTGFVFVYARKSEIEAIEKAINQINENFSKPIPLKVMVVLASESDLKQIGLNFEFMKDNVSGALSTMSTSGNMFNISVLSKNIIANIIANARSGAIKTIEEKSLVALNGQPVVFYPQSKTRIISKYNLSFVSSIGTGGTGTGGLATTPTITVETQDIETGNKLILVPYFINGTNSIGIDVYTNESRLEDIRYEIVNLQGFENKIALPTTSTKINFNQSVLDKGETLALFTNSMTLQQIQNSGIPFLKDIPVLGHLFKEERRTDEKYRLIITLTYL